MVAVLCLKMLDVRAPPSKVQALQNSAGLGAPINRELFIGVHSQAIQAQQHQELIVVASEMKACVRRGLTLVHVYGEFSATWKVLTQMFRSAAYEKFDKVRCLGMCSHHCTILCCCARVCVPAGYVLIMCQLRNAVEARTEEGRAEIFTEHLE